VVNLVCYFDDCGALAELWIVLDQTGNAVLSRHLRQIFNELRRDSHVHTHAKNALITAFDLYLSEATVPPEICA